MQTLSSGQQQSSSADLASAVHARADTAYEGFNTLRRNGALVPFQPAKISVAMTKAFLAVNGGQGAASARVREPVQTLTTQVVNALMRRQPGGGTFHIEDIQDQVELALMRSGEHDVARAYVLYREKRAQERAAASAHVDIDTIHITENGQRRTLDILGLRELSAGAAQPHQGHQRRKPGRRAFSQGGQRHGRCRQPGRQTQGRCLHISGDVAPGHRGVSRASQEHGRRAAPYARHEHGQLDSRPVHEAGDGKRGMDAVLAVRCPGSARQGGARIRRGLPELRGGCRTRGHHAVQKAACRQPMAKNAFNAV